MEIQELYELYLASNLQVSTDTRNIIPGGMFFALKGGNFNGNAFAEESIKKGAKYAIIDEIEFQVEGCVLVDNVLTTLQNLATYHRIRFDIPVIGITGSNGKTTSKELLNAVVSKKYKTHCTLGNLNNHIGVPLTLLSMPMNTEFAIVEMGANKPGDIQELCSIARPNFGVITNVGKAHLEGFGSFEGVIQTKTEMYRFIDQNQGKLFVNSNESELVNQAIKFTDVVFYGHNTDLTVQVLSSENELKVKIENHEIQSRLFGSYNAQNILTAYAIGGYFGVDNEDIIKAIENYIPSNNRSQILITPKNNRLVLDAYNANPTSMNLAIAEMIADHAQNKIYIIGGMKELGSVSKEEHLAILNVLKSNNQKNVFLVGGEFLEFQNNFLNFNFFASVQDLIIKNPFEKIENCSFLIKGSRGVQLEKIVPHIS